MAKAKIITVIIVEVLRNFMFHYDMGVSCNAVSLQSSFSISFSDDVVAAENFHLKVFWIHFNVGIIPSQCLLDLFS